MDFSGKEKNRMFGSIFSVLAEMFSYTFLVRAFAVGAMVSVCAALLGVSLVLKRYSMIGDGLSHVGFGSLALATAFNVAPLSVSIPVVIAAAFLLLRLGEKSLIRGDAAVALVSTGSLALGVVIISRTTGMNTDVCNYLFGSILAMSKNDVYLSIALSIAVLVLFMLFYHTLFAITFDETFARAAGVKTDIYNMLIAFLTAVTIVLGMRMMGAVLISALIIFPALTSMRIFKRFKTVSVCSVCVSAVCFFAGIVISYVYAVPTGASVVLVNIFAFILFWLIKIVTTGKRKMMRLAALLFALLCTVSGCGGRRPVSEERGILSTKTAVDEKIIPSGNAAGDIVEIREKMFLAQTNDVYLNPEDYMGKTLKLEGLFKREQYGGHDYCFVLRYGPGCCGSDGNAGFEVAWEKDRPADETYPEVDEWVRASGVLKSYEEDGYPYLYIALSELSVLKTRGAEFVTQ
jgi:zinc transport system permease protein